MTDPLQDAVLALVDRHSDAGLTMGAIVDRLVADGADEQAVELMIWSLIQGRRLTPHGFVCRTMRSANGGESRSYEFVLIPWSPAHDAQLDLDLGLDQSEAKTEAGSAGR